MRCGACGQLAVEVVVIKWRRVGRGLTVPSCARHRWSNEVLRANAARLPGAVIRRRPLLSRTWA